MSTPDKTAYASTLLTDLAKTLARGKEMEAALRKIAEFIDCEPDDPGDLAEAVRQFVQERDDLRKDEALRRKLALDRKSLSESETLRRSLQAQTDDKALQLKHECDEWAKVANDFVALFDPRAGAVTPASFWAVAEGVKRANKELREERDEARTRLAHAEADAEQAVHVLTEERDAARAASMIVEHHGAEWAIERAEERGAKWAIDAALDPNMWPLSKWTPESLCKYRRGDGR